MATVKDPADRTRACVRCGGSFTVPYPSTRKTRCNDCHYRDRKQRADTGARKAKWVTVSCGHCGAPCERRPGDVAKHERRGWRIYCSYRCRDACAAPGSFGNGTGRPVGRDGHGARWIDAEGYVRVYVPLSERPPGHMKSSMLEHRIVMARVLRRHLVPSETVHHINGDKTDNRPENLELHAGPHGKDCRLRCRTCGSHDIEAVGLKRQSERAS